MVDTTWVRAYNNKSVWTSQTMQADVSMNSAAFYYTSDQRLKTDIKKIEDPIGRLSKLNGYNFIWKKDGRKDI